MRTQVLADIRPRFPWLEAAASGGAFASQIDLDRFPFTIGRNESCDLTIPSTRVSRDHAAITTHGAGYRIQDGGSTNGTFVNGKRIEEFAALGDGDVIRIADVEFSFHTGKSGQRVAATMPFAGSELSPEENEARSLIHSLRCRQEALLHRALRLRFQPVVDLQTNQPVGYEALRRIPMANTEDALHEKLLASTECRLMEREHDLLRRLAVEQGRKLPACSRLWLGLEATEVGADALPPVLRQLQSHLGPDRQLVVCIPDSAIADIAYFRSFIARMREASLGVAFDGFTGGPNQVRVIAPFAPDYLKLAPALVRGIERSSDRQSQVQGIVQAARALNIAVMATGVHTESELEACRRLGCKLAQGDHLGSAQTVDWPLIPVQSPA
jgi:EAL domain-containing protein (putative c-di-GMP-specific phosphodiesterase class I)